LVEKVITRDYAVTALSMEGRGGLMSKTHIGYGEVGRLESVKTKKTAKLSVKMER